MRNAATYKYQNGKIIDFQCTKKVQYQCRKCFSICWNSEVRRSSGSVPGIAAVFLRRICTIAVANVLIVSNVLCSILLMNTERWTSWTTHNLELSDRKPWYWKEPAKTHFFGLCGSGLRRLEHSASRVRSRNQNCYVPPRLVVASPSRDCGGQFRVEWARGQGQLFWGLEWGRYIRTEG